MYIKQIKIDNFRNYNSVVVNLNSNINIFYGNNASGKTNLLESIYVLGLTKSHRAVIDNSLTRKGSNFFHLEGILVKKNFTYKLEIINKLHKKLFIDNKEINKISTYISKLNIIIFYPEDLDIIKGSPSGRRNFLDLDLMQLYSNYINILNEYNKLLKMRNEILKQKKIKNYQYLQILTNYLIDRGIMINKMRASLVDYLNEYCGIIYKNLTGNKNFFIKYKPNVKFNNVKDSKIKYLKLFKDNFNRELKLNKTLFGPHLDDLEFYLDDKNLKYYGSQGQQRIAIISLKLAELFVFKKYKKCTPILLLDDVFSELDINKKNNLLKYISDDIQTIITTTDLDSFDKKILNKAKLFEIKNGKILEK